MTKIPFPGKSTIITLNSVVLRSFLPPNNDPLCHEERHKLMNIRFGGVGLTQTLDTAHCIS